MTRFRAIAFLGAGSATLVVVGLILALARPPLPNRLPPASPSAPIIETPTQTVVPLDIAEQLDLGPHQVVAMAVTTSVVWLATQSPTSGDSGRLFRIDATTARATASWSTGGDPVAVAAAGDFVWVANGSGNRELTPSLQGEIPPDENTVQQFNAASGVLVHTFALLDPRGIVASPASALVISAAAANRTVVSVLAGGARKMITTLPGSMEVPISSLSTESALAVCSDHVYLALSNRVVTGSSVTIYSLQPSGGPVDEVTTIPDDYEASMTCDATSVFLIGAAGDGETSVTSVSLAKGSIANLWEGPYPVTVAFLSGRIWIAYSDDVQNQSVLTSLDPVTGIPGPTRSILPPSPNIGFPNLVIPGDTGLWIAASLGSTLLHVATS
jgi:hypothetical protein